MDVPHTAVNLLRHITCAHDGEHRTVSDWVIDRDDKPDFGPGYQIVRKVIVCVKCGWPVEVRDIERAI